MKPTVGTKQKRQAGRPSISSDELHDTILQRIIGGESLRGICEDEAMPGRTTVIDWLESNEEFRAKYARARELAGDALDERIQHEADVATEEDWQVRKLRIETMKWRASKLAPKKYGDAPAQNTVNVGVAVNNVMTEDRRKELLDKKRAASERRLKLKG